MHVSPYAKSAISPRPQTAPQEEEARRAMLSRGGISSPDISRRTAPRPPAAGSSINGTLFSLNRKAVLFVDFLYIFFFPFLLSFPY